MIYYLRLHFDFLFNRIFIFIYLLVLGFYTLGLTIAADLDQGYYYLDGFRNEQYLVYLSESFMISQIVIGVLSILIGSNLAGKANEFMIGYTTENYGQRSMFLFSRYLVGMLVIIMTVGFAICSTIVFMIFFTPFVFNIDQILIMYGWIMIEAFFFFFLTSFLYSILNSFLVLLLPIGLFWYKKTLYYSQELKPEAKAIMKLIPTYYLEGEKVLEYAKIENYILPLLGIILICYLINLFKDCR